MASGEQAGHTGHTGTHPLCPEHNDPFRFFDENCGRVICRDCFALSHCGHTCVLVAEAASKYRQEMEALVTKASSQVEKVKVAEGQVMRASDSMKEARKKRNDEIQEFFQQVRRVFVISSNEIEKISGDQNQKFPEITRTTYE